MKRVQLKRRRFLRLGAGALVGSGLALAGVPRFARAAATHRRHLVCVYLQGGADGLSLLPPLRDPAYAALRAQTAVPAGRVIALAGGGGALGLHPAFAPLAPLAERGELRAIAGIGMSGVGSSHARAERKLFEALRASSVPWIVEADEERAPSALSVRLAAVAEAIAADEPLPAVLLTVPGFDTHAAQARRLEQAFGQLARDLGDFVARLRSLFADTRVLVVSEFGRGLRENRRAGTEDGAAGAALLLGGRLSWPGIAEPGWLELGPLAASGADALPVAVELRDVLAAVEHELFGARSPASGEVPRG